MTIIERQESGGINMVEIGYWHRLAWLQKIIKIEYSE